MHTFLIASHHVDALPRWGILYSVFCFKVGYDESCTIPRGRLRAPRGSPTSQETSALISNSVHPERLL